MLMIDLSPGSTVAFFCAVHSLVGEGRLLLFSFNSCTYFISFTVLPFLSLHTASIRYQPSGKPPGRANDFCGPVVSVVCHTVCALGQVWKSDSFLYSSSGKSFTKASGVMIYWS